MGRTISVYLSDAALAVIKERTKDVKGWKNRSQVVDQLILLGGGKYDDLRQVASSITEHLIETCSSQNSLNSEKS